MKRILLAEDEEILRMLIVDTLESEDYVIDEACDGEEAWEFFKMNDYELIIMDNMMPGMTGLELLEKIREVNQDVHILMLSAKSQTQDQYKVLAAGANEFLAKPFSPLKLHELVEDILHEG